MCLKEEDLPLGISSEEKWESALKREDTFDRSLRRDVRGSCKIVGSPVSLRLGSGRLVEKKHSLSWDYSAALVLIYY